MVNPYDPQNPAKPDYFGGREDTLKTAKERVEKAIVQKQSGGILVYGYRGVGKTSLLKKIASMAAGSEEQATNRVVVYRRLSKTVSDNELYQMITESAAEEIENKKRLTEKIGGVVSSIRPSKIGPVELVHESIPKEKTPYFRWNALVENVKNAEFMLIALDDADFLSPEALGELKTIIEAQNKTPVILVVSGGIEFEERLVDDYSPVARIFSGASFDIGEFKLEETREVLEKPVAGTGTSWTEGGIFAAQELSKGYPYLVQCIASASFIENGTITDQIVKDSIKKALDIGKGWLSHELKNASDNDIIYFLKITQINKQTLRSSDMQKAGVAAPYIGRLVRLKVIKKISRGRYVLQKAPIIAYYHQLLRGIEV